MALTREAILARRSPPRSVDVPEWGGEVLLRKITGTEREQWERWVNEQKEEQGSSFVVMGRAALLVRCLVDSEGNRLFADGQIEELSGADASGAVLDRLWDIACEMNCIGMSSSESVLKNSEAGRSG